MSAEVAAREPSLEDTPASISSEVVATELAGIDSHIEDLMRSAGGRAGSRGIEAVQTILERPNLRYLCDDYTIGVNVAHGVALRPDTNLRLLEDMQEAGVVDALLQSPHGDLTVLFQLPYKGPSYYSNTPDERATQAMVYDTKRAELTSLVTTPGFGRVVKSAVGRHVTFDIVNGFLADRKHAVSEWQASLDNFLAMLDDEQTFQATQTIARTNPAVLRLLVPHPSNTAPSIDEQAALLRDLAEEEQSGISEVLIDGARWSGSDITQKLRFVHAYQYVGLHKRINSSVRARYDYLNEDFSGWLLDDHMLELETKRELLADPVFAKGLAAAIGDDEYDNRLRSLKGTDYINAVINASVDPDEILSRLKGSPNMEITSGKIGLFVNFYRKFGLDCFDLFRTWDTVGSTPDDTLKAVRSNIGTMLQLESRQAGTCRKLREEFFIRHFGRYGADILFTQYQERANTDLESALAVFMSTDHNLSLWGFAQKAFRSIYREVSDLGYKWRIFEAASRRELALVGARARRQYKGDAGLRFGVVAGHAYGKDGRGIDIAGVDEALLSSDLVDTTRIVPIARHTSLKGIFAPRSPLVFHVCNAAKETRGQVNISRASTRALGVVAFASPIVSSLGDVYIQATPEALDVDGVFYETSTQHIAGVRYDP